MARDDASFGARAEAALGSEIASFKDDNLTDALAPNSELQGMQLAMIAQPVCDQDLLRAASEKFQRGWFEAVVLERAAKKQCGWLGCGAALRPPRLAAKLKAARTGDDVETYCSTACFRIARGFAGALPYKVTLQTGAAAEAAAAAAAAGGGGGVGGGSAGGQATGASSGGGTGPGKRRRCRT